MLICLGQLPNTYDAHYRLNSYFLWEYVIIHALIFNISLLFTSVLKNYLVTTSVLFT